MKIHLSSQYQGTFPMIPLTWVTWELSIPTGYGGFEEFTGSGVWYEREEIIFLLKKEKNNLYSQRNLREVGLNERRNLSGYSKGYIFFLV